MAFCPRCGQSADVDVPTLKSFLHDAASAVFTYDSKFWRTLNPLITQPGQLSVEYVEGRRAPYVNPVPLYVWLQAICFFFFSMTFNQAMAAQQRPKVILGCTIVSAVVLAILYFPKKRKFGEHLVFSLHFNSFLLLTLTVVYPLIGIIAAQLVRLHRIPQATDVGPQTTLVAVAIMVPYLFFALNRFYKERWYWTLIKLVGFYKIYFTFFLVFSKYFEK